MTDLTQSAPVDEAELMRLAEQVAREAGELVRRALDGSIAVAATKSSGVDLVTEVDQAAEALIRRRLAELRPDDGILGEEEGWHAGSSGLVWVVDPIDGTTNFVYGLPAYSVSIAVARVEGEDPFGWPLLAGAVHAPATGRTWSAGRGQGAYADGERLAVAVAPTPFVDDSYMSQRIRILDAQTGAVLTQIENPGKLGALAWSPSGAHLAFVSAADINDPAAGRLMVADAATGAFEDVLPDYEGHVGALAWEDDDTIRYSAGRGVESVMQRVRRTGGEPGTLLSEGFAVFGGFSVSGTPYVWRSMSSSRRMRSNSFSAPAGVLPPWARVSSVSGWISITSQSCVSLCQVGLLRPRSSELR